MDKLCQLRQTHSTPKRQQLCNCAAAIHTCMQVGPSPMPCGGASCSKPSRAAMLTSMRHATAPAPLLLPLSIGLMSVSLRLKPYINKHTCAGTPCT